MVKHTFFVPFLFVFYSDGVAGQYDNCTGQLDKIDDGECNMDNNNADCGYDGGDCCECSCTSDRLYPCGVWGFNCSDPDVAGNEGDCYNETASIRHCVSDATVTWLVSDAPSAFSLAEAINCFGGSFNVTWLGSVFIERTLYIPNGTTLSVTGEGSGAEVNGGGKTRLFMAVGADLYISGLILSNGNATYGGAIAAMRSSIVLNQTIFSGNTASSYGGAINVGIASTLICEGSTMFEGNYASRGGGAVAISMGSRVVIGDDSLRGAGFVNGNRRTTRDWGTYFANNTANYSGGALFVSSYSNVSWDGETSFENNTANYNGGGLSTDSNSSVSWTGETSFVGNTAKYDGGALYISSHSIVSWDGETSFDGNAANFTGGALFVFSDSIVSWDGETSFVNNTADNGGALYIYWDSFVSWVGETSFFGNTADNGGALYIYWGSLISWDGETSFVNNTAGVSGGAMYIFWDSRVSWNGQTSFVGNTAGEDGGTLSIVWNSIVSWDGKTFFVGNTANSNGGVLYISVDSNVSWDGETSFVRNMASDDGASLYVYRYSIVSWGGDTSFFGNTAIDNGGALSVFLGSSVSWDGETSFVNNTADNGGALYIHWDSFVSWNGETSFVGSTAIDNGGALFISSYSSISWYGTTRFANSTANGRGGAWYISTKSIVFWDGETSFFGNTANFSGGALYISSGSTLLWDGATNFASNRANIDGGALLISLYSNVSWNGKTSFTGNIAKSSGGAIYVETGSKLAVGGDTWFRGNEAAIDGGAAYVYVSHDAYPSYFILDSNAAVHFQGNTCGGNGGAIAFTGEVVTRFSLNMTFFGNTAGVSGGAILLSGTTIGMLFEGVIFRSNSAAIGGGLYLTGSGTAVTGGEDGNPEYNPTTFIGCEFNGNTAMKTGGAMDSGAGRDLIVNTSFVDNTASLGGALRLVGTTSLFGCEFVNNLSGEDGGPGISNDGVISDLSHCSFVGNAFNCQTGFFLDYNDTDALFDTVCKGCDTQCTECTIKDKEPICLEELDHSYSTGGNTTLESLLIERGYWRATNTSTDILACYNTDACLGGFTGEQGYCSKGYEGPYCSVCSKGYTASLGFACNKCSDNAAGGIALAVAMSVLFFSVSVAFLSYMLFAETEGADRGIVARVTRFIPLQSVKIVIVVWQIVTQFSTVASAVFPSVYQKFLDGVDILNFDLSWMLAAKCIIVTDFHDQLLLATLGPLVCIVILGGTYVAAIHKIHHSEAARAFAYRKHVSMVLLLTFLVYSSVSSTLFKTFACDELDDGKIYLRADYRIECDSPKHSVLMIYSGFMVIPYVVGIPAFYGILLYNNREAFTKAADREEDESIKFITDLWKPYKPNRFYYEVVECIRRVLLTGALVFIYPNTAAQVAVALMMATFFTIVSEALAPYASKWDTWISRTGHAIVFTSMFLALLLKVDVSGELASSQAVFEWVLVSAHSCLILGVVVEAIAMIMAWRQGVQEESQPRIHPSLSVFSPGVGRVGII